MIFKSIDNKSVFKNILKRFLKLLRKLVVLYIFTMLPAYYMADAGYDIWMGNLRGNRYSREHEKYTTRDSKYWDFR